jgi:translation initiation factor eIF-2B subunit delta
MLDEKFRSIEEAIEGIAADNTSGAAEILHHCAGVFSLLKYVDRASISIHQAREIIIKICVALVKSQPDMSALLRLASQTIEAAYAKSSCPEVFSYASDAACRFVESATLSAHGAALCAADMIREGSTVLTHSRSSTVLEALLEARRSGKSFEVILTESRPMFEGRKLASELDQREIKVTIIADAAASLFLERADSVLVGADKILPDYLVNKIGTRMIALAAREGGTPMYSICDSSKFIEIDCVSDSELDQADPHELWLDAPNGVTVVNRYFESTPLEYFTGIVTEHGLLSSTEASACAREASIDQELSDALKAQSARIK